MGGLLGVEKLKGVLNALFSAEVVVEDAVNKAYVQLFSDLMALAAILRTGVDLKAAGQELMEADGEDQKALVAYLQTKTQGLSNKQLGALVQEAGELLVEVGNEIANDVAVGRKVAAFVNKVKGA